MNYDEVKQSIEKAHQMINDLCHQRRSWVMSIPARPDYDPDLVIGKALRDAEELIKQLERELDEARGLLEKGYNHSWNIDGEFKDYLQKVGRLK